MKKILSVFLGHPSRIIILLVVLFTLNFQLKEKWSGPNWQVINSDGKGYYAFLPAIFIYHDMQFNFAADYEKKYYSASPVFFCNEIDGKKFDKYFCGVSVLLLPFFLLAWIFSGMMGFEPDGYSYIFQCAMGLAALFYLVCGLIFLRKLLAYYCNDKISAALIFAFFFGTNLMYYTWVEPCMSHVYSFSLFCGFLYFSKKVLLEKKQSDLFKAVLFYAFIILVRPSNAIIILVLPFLAGSKELLFHLFRFVFADAKRVIKAAALFCSIVFLQFLMYYLQTGHWFIYAYTNERFDFAHPEIMNVLFSYRKGLFVYTPLILVSLIGLFYLLRKDRFRFFSILLLLCVTVWVISSWWSWYYGGSYGHRAFIEYFPVFAVLLAILLNAIRNFILKGILLSVITLCVALNIVQTWQFYHVIIPWDGMTKDRYWTVFLKTDNRYIGIFTPNAFIPEELSGDNIAVFKNDLDPAKEWFDMNTLSDEMAHSGTHSSKISGDVNKSISFTKKIKDLFPEGDSAAYIQVKLWAWIAALESNAQIVISFEQGGKSYSWNTFYIAHQVTDAEKWTACVANVKVPKPVAEDDAVWVYVMKDDKRTVYLDDFEISFLHKKE